MAWNGSRYLFIAYLVEYLLQIVHVDAVANGIERAGLYGSKRRGAGEGSTLCDLRRP